MRRFVFSLFCFSVLANSGLLHAHQDGQPKVEVLSDYRLKLSLPTSASPERIWALWKDVENWKQFDTLLEYSHLDEGHTF